MPELTDPRKYTRIADEVRQLITRGQLRTGQRVPSIGTLSRDHGVTRETSARALRLLEREGLLTRYPGHGYIVAFAPKAGQ